MSAARILAAALALCAAAAAGCGLGPGKEEGDVALTVTRDYGTKVMLQKTDSIRESETVLRLLDRNTDITTRYGGGFIQSIDGLAGARSGGRQSDWFFYVNGVESPIGSAQYRPSGGDRIWWDYRYWTAAMRVPAVIGSWPEPFVTGFQGRRFDVNVNCSGDVRPACGTVSARIRRAGGRLAQGESGESLGDVLVGTWPALQWSPTARLLAQPPSDSGVFARFVSIRKPLLEVLNQQGQPAGSIGKGGGLIAALRPGDAPPTWVVTGTDAEGVAAAANLVGDSLRNHYALATQPGAGPIGVPVP